jgi:hypothetical protein
MSRTPRHCLDGDRPSQRTAASTGTQSISALPETSGVPLSIAGIPNESMPGSNGAEPR